LRRTVPVARRAKKQGVPPLIPASATITAPPQGPSGVIVSVVVSINLTSVETVKAQSVAIVAATGTPGVSVVPAGHPSPGRVPMKPWNRTA
jgi:hypothetical protein